MIIADLEQQTPEWLTMRCGMVTGSRMADVMAKLKRKDGMAAARLSYLHEVAVARLTGLTPDTFVSPAMQWGTVNEPFARAAYEVATDNAVEQIGFAIHPKIEWFGASPDGLIGTDGLIEIKCPTSQTHLGYLLAGEVPEEYKPQMLAEMACTERKWCEFVSYDPRMPKKLQLFIRRFERDEPMISAMELEVIQFLKEVEELLSKLEAL